MSLKLFVCLAALTPILERRQGESESRARTGIDRSIKSAITAG